MGECAGLRAGMVDLPLERKSWIDSEYSNGESMPKVCQQYFLLLLFPFTQMAYRCGTVSGWVTVTEQSAL